jgi:hypothetical protein
VICVTLHMFDGVFLQYMLYMILNNNEFLLHTCRCQTNKLDMLHLIDLTNFNVLRLIIDQVQHLFHRNHYQLL